MGKQFLTMVTRKGQITIPVEIRRTLGIAEGDQVALVLEDDQQVRLARQNSVVARTAGMLKSVAPPLSAEELRAAGEDAIASSVAERSGE